MSNSKLVPVEVLDLDDEAVDRLRRISERRRLDEYSDDSQVYPEDTPVEVLELDDEAVDRLRRISERRRLDEYSDDSQVYIGDIFPKDLEDIVP
jgi:cyanate lyase